MSRIIKLAAAVLVMFTFAVPASAQKARDYDYVTVQISPDKPDWDYNTGEKVTFTIAVIRDTYPQKNVDVKWEWGPDMLKATSSGTVNTGSGYKTVTVPGMKKPGFMTLKGTVTIDGVSYSNYTTVAFDPFKIEPHAKYPADFREFWDRVLEQSRKVPIEPLMILMPERCTPYADVYHVRFNNGDRNRYVYGVLSLPKGEGPFPVVFQVPGAGVRAYKGNQSYAPHGVIHFEIGIHGIPIDLPDELYVNLRTGALSGYNKFNCDNRDTYYYKHVYAGCVRAVDFLCTLPQVDTERLAVMGGSQGGALSIITASLDNRIKMVASNYPALSDISGYYYGGTGGWPHLFKDPKETNIEVKVRVSEYYDVVNFARGLQVPVRYSIGYNDMVCPPTSFMAVYNVIPGEKIMDKTNYSAHWRFPESSAAQQKWLIEELKR